MERINTGRVGCVVRMVFSRSRPSGPFNEMSTIKTYVLIVDISLNGPDGLDLLKTIRTTHPTLPVLILSMHDESIYAERALRAGATGYIMKQEATEKVLVAVRRILNVLRFLFAPRF